MTETSTEAMSFDDIRAAVDDNGGVVTVRASQLRAAIGAGRLTFRINSDIHDALLRLGLGHVPYYEDEMPTNQHEPVRVYDRTTALGKVIDAAHTVGVDFDDQLREAVDEKAADTLNQIRRLVEQ